MTTPKVLAIAMAACRAGGGTPLAASRGATARESAITLAPTEPFIGPISAPSAMPETSGPVDPRPRIATLVLKSESITRNRSSSAPISTNSGSACSRSFSSNPTSRPGNALSRSIGTEGASMPTPAPTIDTTIRITNAGSPVNTSPSPIRPSRTRPNQAMTREPSRNAAGGRRRSPAAATGPRAATARA